MLEWDTLGAQSDTTDDELAEMREAQLIEIFGINNAGGAAEKMILEIF